MSILSGSLQGYYLYEGLIVFVTIFVVVAIRWFLEPYFSYKKRNTVKDYVMYIDSGKKLSKKQLGTPYLLRDNDEQPKLLSLSLVVPAYNEEQRLPHMLKTHIKFIQEQQRDGELPG